ncbi:hypothetical protein C4K68_28390 [Pokkaliibacter plantistimulans]|uniref:Uncharacterized protein n=1 Tax=Proteobacteria bacterium 228 TaxID=2083153 RepID=A0A2S5KHG4_9PROT|nr:hypothetical protein [Pokkaliibacter plantistimulans]PPC74033.1 hypothetical protein C4K68_28390 [Pokkaliibacter plantistimulans]
MAAENAWAGAGASWRAEAVSTDAVLPADRGRCGGHRQSPWEWLSMVSGERIGLFWQGMSRAEVMALMGYRARFSMTSTAMMAALPWCICPLSV